MRSEHANVCETNARNLTCLIDDDLQVASLRRRGDSENTPVVTIAKVSDNTAVMRVSVQDLIDDIDARAVVQ